MADSTCCICGGKAPRCLACRTALDLGPSEVNDLHDAARSLRRMAEAVGGDRLRGGAEEEAKRLVDLATRVGSIGHTITRTYIAQCDAA